MISKNTVILSYRFGIEDYRIILVNFKQSNVGGYRVNICSPVIYRLMYENNFTVEKCIKKSLDLLQFHKIDKKLDKIETEWDNKDNLSREERLDKIDA